MPENVIIRAKAITMDGVAPPNTTSRSGRLRPVIFVLTERYATNSDKIVPMQAAIIPYPTERQILSRYCELVMTGIQASIPKLSSARPLDILTRKEVTTMDVSGRITAMNAYPATNAKAGHFHFPSSTILGRVLLPLIVV